MNFHMPAETELEPSASGEESPGKVHQCLDDGSDPSALGRMPDRHPVADQPQLADEAQDVIHQRGTGKDQFVGGKLSRRQPLQVQSVFSSEWNCSLVP